MEYKLPNIPISQWNEDDKPREKLMLKGTEALSDAELLAILIGSGNREESALALCQRMLSDVENNLDSFCRLSLKDLMKYKGIGEAKAITILAALEIGKRRRATLPKDKPAIRSSSDAYEAIAYILEEKPYEEFWILHLNRANKLTKTERISVGGISSTIVEVRLIAKSCIENLTSSVVLCHNHPSESLSPSQEDRILTKKIKAALKLFDIAVMDHIIVCGRNYYSFADNNLLSDEI
jgi:DNA repair protein RadC